MSTQPILLTCAERLLPFPTIAPGAVRGAHDSHHRRAEIDRGGPAMRECGTVVGRFDLTKLAEEAEKTDRIREDRRM